MLNSGIIGVIRHMFGRRSFKILICAGFLFQREFQNKSIQQSGRCMHKGCSSTVNEEREFCNPFTPRTVSKGQTQVFDDGSNCI